MQRDVVKLVLNRDAVDPVAESTALAELSDYFISIRITKEQCSRSIRLLANRLCVDADRHPLAELRPLGSQLEEELALEDDEMEKKTIASRIAKDKQQAWNEDRTTKLGDNPKAYRAERRASLPQGFHISTSSKRAGRTVHRLGQCCMILGLDYVQYVYHGAAMPTEDLFDQTCNWCAKSTAFDCSLGTDTSSSSQEQEA